MIEREELQEKLRQVKVALDAQHGYKAAGQGDLSTCVALRGTITRLEAQLIALDAQEQGKQQQPESRAGKYGGCGAIGITAPPHVCPKCQGKPAEQPEPRAGDWWLWNRVDDEHRGPVQITGKKGGLVYFAGCSCGDNPCRSGLQYLRTHATFLRHECIFEAGKCKGCGQAEAPPPIQVGTRATWMMEAVTILAGPNAGGIVAVRVDSDGTLWTRHVSALTNLLPPLLEAEDWFQRAKSDPAFEYYHAVEYNHDTRALLPGEHIIVKGEWRKKEEKA